jgi:hypothetical protein
MIKINVVKNHEFKSGALRRAGYGNFEFVTYYINLKQNDFNKKPARRIFKGYDIIKELYGIDNMLHKLNGPAEVIYEDCRIICKRYYEYGEFIKEKIIKPLPSKNVLANDKFYD